MSCRKSRRSKGSDAVKASTSGMRPRANLPRMRLRDAAPAGAAVALFLWPRRSFTVERAEQRAACIARRDPRASVGRPQLARTSARRTTHRTVGMGDMNVHFVVAMIAVPRARTGHQLGLRSRRLELDDLAQLCQSLPLARAIARSLKPASLIKPLASDWS
jgi:hypothetical protein